MSDIYKDSRGDWCWDIGIDFWGSRKIGGVPGNISVERFVQVLVYYVHRKEWGSLSQPKNPSKTMRHFNKDYKGKV